MMFLKLNRSLIPDNPTDVAESPIWNTLIPSRLELPNDIDNSDDNENEDDNNNDGDDEDDVAPMPVKSEEANYTC